MLAWLGHRDLSLAAVRSCAWENLHLDHWIKLYHKKGTSIIEWLDMRSGHNDDIETSHTANTNLFVSRPKLKSLYTGIRFKLFTSHGGGALIVLHMWFNHGTLTEALREAAKFFLVSIWNLTESWRMKATIKIMNNLPFSTVYLFIYLPSHSFPFWWQTIVVTVHTKLSNMEGPIYITGTIHRQCNCPIKYHLNADYSTLKLVLGHHYTGSRFCYWYFVWSSTFGYWILIRIGVLAKSEFLFGNILYMIYHMMSKRQFHFFK